MKRVRSDAVCSDGGHSVSSSVGCNASVSPAARVGSYGACEEEWGGRVQCACVYLESFVLTA
jgi:hypothetical protein